MNQIQKKIIITGTHLTPALELIRQLQNDNEIKWQISYIGRRYNSNDKTNTSIESKIIPSLNIDYYSISCGKFDRRFLPNTIAGIPKIISGLFQAFSVINKIKPDIIVSFGGYVSVPVIFIAFLKGITSITHEQTLTNSLTTKINSFFVNKIALSFNNQKQINNLPKNKIVVTGNLLRYQLFENQPNCPKNLQINKKLPTIYITAGNQGSHSINAIIKKLIPNFNNYNIIHQTGKEELEIFKKFELKYPHYFVSDYFNTNDFSWIINHSDLLVSRSGANTSQEIVAFNKKSILIPLPKSQQNEQLLNAQWVQKNLPSQTIILSQEELSSDLLLSAINKLVSVKSNKKQIKHYSNLKLLELIHEIV